MIYYADVYCNPVTHKEYENQDVKNERLKVREILRGLAAEIRGYSEEKWFFNYPSIKKINEVSSSLIGLSNSLVSRNGDYVIEFNEKRIKTIKKNLGLRSKI